jgi:putative transposase
MRGSAVYGEYAEARELAIAFGYTTRVRSRGEEADRIRRKNRFRARRWVVERTHSWLSRFRQIVVRWEKKTEKYLAMRRLSCDWNTYNALGLPG